MFCSPLSFNVGTYHLFTTHCEHCIGEVGFDSASISSELLEILVKLSSFFCTYFLSVPFYYQLLYCISQDLLLVHVCMHSLT